MSPAGERLPAAGSRPWTSAMTAAVKACPATFGLVPLNEASGVSHLFRFRDDLSGISHFYLRELEPRT